MMAESAMHKGLKGFVGLRGEGKNASSRKKNYRSTNTCILVCRARYIDTYDTGISTSTRYTYWDVFIKDCGYLDRRCCLVDPFPC
jgi:hypothetical protein